MILSTNEIEKLCRGNADTDLIYPYDPSDNLGNPAKIELHLGEHCYCSSEPDKIHVLKENDKVIIKPNTIFLFETKEKFNFPQYLSGRMSLKMKLIAQGLLMSNQTVVDPGYSNVLFGMLYNLSTQNIELKYGQAITTLEVIKTEVSKNTYTGNIENLSFEQFVANRVHSSLGSLEEDIKKSKEDIVRSQNRLDKSTKIWNFFTVFVTLLLTILSVFIGVTNFRAASKDDADIEILKNEVTALQEQIENYRESTDNLEELVIEYQKKIDELEKLLSEMQP